MMGKMIPPPRLSASLSEMFEPVLSASRLAWLLRDAGRVATAVHCLQCYGHRGGNTLPPLWSSGPLLWQASKH